MNDDEYYKSSGRRYYVGRYDPYLSLQVISENLHVAQGVHFQFTSKSVKYNFQPL